MEFAWNTKENSEQQRTTIYIKIYERIYKSNGNYKTAIDSVPSSDRWTNRKD